MLATETDFYMKKGTVSIQCDDEEIVVIRRGSKTAYSHILLAMIPMILVSIVFGIVLMFPDSSTEMDFIIVGSAFVVILILSILVLAAIWSVRETVTLDEEGLHVHYNWFRPSICRFVPLRELGDFIRWTIIHSQYYNGIRVGKYKRYEVHARTLGNRVCFAYGMNEDFCQAMARRLQDRLEILRSMAEMQSSERCLLHAGKTLSHHTRGEVPPLGIAKHSKPQNLLPTTESRWQEEIDEFGDLILSNAKKFNMPKLFGFAMGTLATVFVATSFIIAVPPAKWGEFFAECGFGVIITLGMLAIAGLAVTFTFLWMIVGRFHRSRWCFSKNGSVERISRLFGIPRQHYYEDGMQFAFMVISDDYGSLDTDQYNFSDDRWELIFYNASRKPMFRIDSLYRGEAHWLADQLLKFCGDS